MSDLRKRSDGHRTLVLFISTSSPTHILLIGFSSPPTNLVTSCLYPPHPLLIYFSLPCHLQLKSPSHRLISFQFLLISAYFPHFFFISVSYSHNLIFRYSSSLYIPSPPNLLIISFSSPKLLLISSISPLQLLLISSYPRLFSSSYS